MNKVFEITIKIKARNRQDALNKFFELNEIDSGDPFIGEDDFKEVKT